MRGGPFEQMLATIRLIGKAIRAGSRHLPIRNHAATLATRARPKDYLGQLSEIYKDAVTRWRYVKDPVSRELVTFDPTALANLVLALDGVGVGGGRGAGDCDCITAAVGAEMESIGFPVRIAVTAPPQACPGKLFAHVFPQAFVQGFGWVTVDPVVWPKYGFGHTPKHSRIAFFNLDGRLTGYRGNVVGLAGYQRRF